MGIHAKGLRRGASTIALIAAIAALSVPTTAPAGGDLPEYGGRVEGDPYHYIGFDVLGSGDNRRIKNVFLVGIPFACEGEVQMDREYGPVPDARVPVRADGTFDKIVHGTKNKSFRFKLAGRIRGNRARGVYNLSFGDPRCYTATFRWRARKPSAPIPAARGGAL